MAGPLTWWANRKSRIGLQPLSKEPPPIAPGKPWWTTPPIAAPEPEHIEYVVQFVRQLQAGQGSGKRAQEVNAMLGRCSDWLRSARRLLHERTESQRGDLETVDGVIIMAERWLQRLKCKCGKAGLLSPEEDAELDDLRQALQARSARIKRRKATGGVS